MRVEQISIFLDVYRLGSFAAAARSRGTDPSIVSKTITGFEAALGVRLFHRTTRKLSPTDEATNLFERLSGPIDEIHSSLEQVRDSSHRASGQLRISASVSYGLERVVPRLSEFGRQYPDISVDLVLTDRRVDLVHERIDVAIRHGTLEDSELVARKLHDVQYELFTSQTYVSEHGMPRAPQELSHHRILTLNYPQFAQGLEFARLHRPKAKRMKALFTPVLLAGSAIALRDAALNDLGIAVLPNWINARSLKRVLPDHLLVSGSGTAVWQLTTANRFLPQRTRAWLNFTASAMP